MTPERLAEIRVLIGSWGVSVPIWATELLSALRERDEQIAKLRAALNEAAQVAMLKYEVTHKGSGPPSDYDPDVYQLERVTSVGWWRFVHAVRDAEKATAPEGERDG